MSTLLLYNIPTDGNWHFRFRFSRKFCFFFSGSQPTWSHIQWYIARKFTHSSTAFQHCKKSALDEQKREIEERKWTEILANLRHWCGTTHYMPCCSEAYARISIEGYSVETNQIKLWNVTHLIQWTLNMIVQQSTKQKLNGFQWVFGSFFLFFFVGGCKR